jgi:succinoglycan biosynthesis transport protein ExoP
MELRRYLHVLRQRLTLILVTVIVGACIGYVTTSRVTEYRTSAQLYVGARQLEQDPVQLYGLAGFNQVVTTFAAMIPTAVFAEKAIQSTGVSRQVGTVLGETSATVVTNTNLIDVTVKDTDPVVAQKLANGISEAFVAQIQNYDPASSATPGSVPAEPAYVFQQAPLPAAPLGTGLKRKVALGAVFGLIVAILLVLLLDYLDVTIKGPDDLERRLDLPVLAVVPRNRSMPERITIG